MTLGVAALLLATAAAASPRERESFDAGWRFARFGPMPDGSVRPEPVRLEAPERDDSAWRALDLPHDWGIEGPFRAELPNRTGKLPWNGVGWYRKTFQSPATDRGRRVFVDFDGAMSQAKVWLNGHYVGEWPYGYASFRLELTDYLKPGARNVIAVRLQNELYSSRWYPGAGLYRNVWLVRTAPVHVARHGVFVTTPEVSDERARVQLQTSIDNQSDAAVTVTVQHEIFAPADPTRVLAHTTAREVVVPVGKSVAVTESAWLDQPRRWDLRNPNLYAVRTVVQCDGELVDEVTNRFGVRTIEWTANDGFRLNGSRVQLQGVCMHHDLGALGAAVNVRAMQRQLEILREMGVNAIRTSHNPPAPEWMDLCDEMGFLVVDEAFDVWRRAKVPNDYHRFFPEWHERDVTAFVRRDRNHPSVIIWSSGNEVKEQDLGPEGVAVAHRLREIFNREDPTRLVMAGMNRDQPILSGFYRGVDVVGTNYRPLFHARNHDLAPEVPILTSEAASTTSSRGMYFFPVGDGVNDGNYLFHVSSYDLYGPPWRTIPETEFLVMEQSPFVIGQFVWTGFDYLGEPTPYNRDESNLLNFENEADKRRMQEAMDRLGGMPPPRSSYFGIIDLCGFPKDRFYYYQSQWRPDLPMAHLLPHWTWPEREGQVTPVHVYTTGDEAELFINGESQGWRRKTTPAARLCWDDVKYQRGEIEVITYRDGKFWARDVRRTAGAPTQLALEADRPVLQADGRDLAFITIRVCDRAGLLAPRAPDRVHFKVEGPADLVAVDNGDETSHASFQANEVAAFNGLCLAVVRTRASQTGQVKITATADGLDAGTAILTVETATP